MSDAFLSTAIVLLALGMFVSDRVRPDAVALIVLLLAWLTGLVSLEEALAGFGSPAVLIVAAVLVVQVVDLAQLTPRSEQMVSPQASAHRRQAAAQRRQCS